MSINNNLLSKLRQDIQSNPYRKNREGSFVAFNSSSFYYENSNAPLKSTQQIDIDWSKFENHTFFMSAEVKVNLAFEQIINKYPFDGTKQEVENFIDNLTGYEKWVFDSFPRNSGSLHFDGTNHIEVIDQAGVLFPDLSKNNSGVSMLNPQSDSPFSIELQLFVPSQTNQNSIICQKRSSDKCGISLNLADTTSTTETFVQFTVASGNINLSVSGSINKGEFNHICAVLSRDDATNTKLEFYVNETLTDSTGPDNIGYLDIDTSRFTIGSGSSINVGGVLFTPVTTLSGTIDEFKVFHSARTQKLQKLYSQKSIFSTPDLKLYYKFNEPIDLAAPSSDPANSIILDSSGNSLHSYVTNFNSSQRHSSGISNENSFFCPILFPGHQGVINLNKNLLASASLYDQENPNIITRLIPYHYLLEGAENDGFGKNIEGNSSSQYVGNSIPGSGKLGSQQVLLSFLYIWSKYFDELKLFVDQFSNLKYIDYDSENSIPDNFLDFYSQQFGLNLGNLFVDSTIEQYLAGENVSREVGINELALKSVQNEIKRRVLKSLPGILSSKGTQHSIKSFLRAVGIDPNNSIKIREYGGPTKGTLNFSRDNKSEIAAFLKFQSTSKLTSKFLSGSRFEPGYPKMEGSFVKLDDNTSISSSPNDGLYTSGSWTFEGIFKFDQASIESNKNSRNLAMLMSTGSSGEFMWCNLIATPNETEIDESKLNLYFRTQHSPTAPISNVSIDLTGSGIFDGEPWYVSFGRMRKDSISKTALSSSFFLRACKVTSLVGNYYESQGYFSDDYSDDYGSLYNIQENYLNAFNSSGSYIVIGNTALNSSNIYLNGTPGSSSYFDGSVSNIRFWSKYITSKESREHANNPFSTGVELPSFQYNYVTNVSGSFQKLRLDVVHNQDQVYASGTNGDLTLLDFSGNERHANGSGFLTSTNNFTPQPINYTHVSPYFDEISSNQKVRVRGLDDVSLLGLEQPWIRKSPVHSINQLENSTDNNKMSIDFSLVESLNRDIVNSMFCTFEELNNGIGSPNLMFSADYPDIEKLRDVYFNRLSGHIDFVKFFEFYRWFDTSISTFIDQLIPKRTLFKGVNYVVEPHVLERGKVQYYFIENYSLTPQRAGSNPRSINWLTTTASRRF